MNNKVFRKSTLEHISSTEELHDYMRVTSPRLWMLLTIILVLVVGFIIFASTVTMENSLSVPADVLTAKTASGNMETSITLSIPKASEEVVKRGMNVQIEDYTGHIYATVSYDDDRSAEAYVVLDDEDFALPNGTYDAKVIIERISPINFLFN